jgi:hypothetical protein
MANTEQILAKIKKTETDNNEILTNEIPREQSLNFSGLEMKNTNKLVTLKEDEKLSNKISSSALEIINLDSPQNVD